MMLENIMNKKGRIHWYSALILTLLFLYIGIMLPPDLGVNSIIKNLFLIALGVSSFFLFYLKKGSKVRWILFSIMAITMSVWFMSEVFLQRGHIGIIESDLENGIPFCHIAIVNQLLSLPILRQFVSPARLSGTATSVYGMVLIWFWATILIGKGWCSWGCFYGGWDSFFSGILRKPLIKINEKISNKLRFFPFAFLIAMALLSLLMFTPFLCAYLCPFKTVTEFQQVTSFSSWVYFLITVTLFISFCIILPIFIGRRMWCTYMCPFGALQGIIGKVFRVFSLKIDKDKCISCKKCVNTCKTAGITESTLEKKKFTYNCSLCGACIEACPKNAINVLCFGIKDTPKNLFDKITEKLSNIKIISNIRSFISNLIEDTLNPQTFLYFFGLVVLVNFLSMFILLGISLVSRLIIGG